MRPASAAPGLPGWSGLMAGQRVLVTGAGGFVGSHLVERLVADGDSVRAFVRYTSTGTAGWLDTLDAPLRREVEIVKGDVRDHQAVAAAAEGVETVYHLAALVSVPYSFLHPAEVLETNGGGTLTVLLAARGAGVRRLVLASTTEVYGRADGTRLDESHPLRACSPYAASKIAGEKLVECFHAAYGLGAVILRPGNIYGPRQSPSALFSSVIRQALAGDEVHVDAGVPPRDYHYVGDSVDAFVRAGRRPGSDWGVFNVGSGREIRVADLAAAVARLLGRDRLRLVEEANVGGLPTRSTGPARLDTRKVHEALGWSPRVGLEEGVGTTLAWLEARGRGGEAGGV